MSEKNIKVYVLSHYYDTPDVEGNDILGVYSLLEDAQNVMESEATAIQKEFPDDFWDEDMTWAEEFEIHLGHNPKAAYKSATIYCWTIQEMEVQ